jgi:hypothetical protein
VTSRLARVGAGLAVLYVAVAAVTAALSSRPVLPLFDGLAPPTPYAWVNPPPARVRDNVPPKAADQQIPLAADGSTATNVTTDDAQAVVNFEAGSVAAHPPDTGVRVEVTPLDAGTLGALPAGMRAVSNAYRVRLTYAPSQTPVPGLAVKGTVALTAAEAGNRMLYSADAQTWQELKFQPYGADHGVFGEFAAPGWFVVATTTGGTPSAASSSHALRNALLVVAAVVPIVGAALALKLPSPVPVTSRGSGSGRSGARPRPSAAKKRAKRRRR